MTDSDQINQPTPSAPKTRPLLPWIRVVAIVLGFALLYVFYVSDLANNPPGFYVRWLT